MFLSQGLLGFPHGNGAGFLRPRQCLQGSDRLREAQSSFLLHSVSLVSLRGEGSAGQPHPSGGVESKHGLPLHQEAVGVAAGDRCLKSSLWLPSQVPPSRQMTKMYFLAVLVARSPRSVSSGLGSLQWLMGEAFPGPSSCWWLSALVGLRPHLPVSLLCLHIHPRCV